MSEAIAPRFERFLTEVATHFVDVRATDAERDVRGSLEALLDALDVDRCGVMLFDKETPGLVIRLAASRSGFPPVLPGDVTPLLPWYAGEVRAGRRLVFARMPEDLPPEAEAEAAYARRVGMKSHVSVPMRVAGEVQGSLGCALFRERRAWDPRIVTRLEILAAIFGSALYRSKADARVRAAEELNSSILASIPQQLLVLDSSGRVLARNDAWARAAAEGTFPPVTEGSSLEAVLEWSVAHGCRDEEEVAGLRSVIAGERSHFAGFCRHTGVAGGRTYAVTAAPLSGGQGGAVLVHTDVTELQETRAALEASLREVSELKERVEAENVVLREEVRHGHDFDEIVGTSPALSRVLAQVEQVAPTDAPVLLLGETGTGKDLVARALHDRSRRRERPLVTVNCAALPSTLVESELFGYEKGAFTGALQRTIGRFEVAHGGTLFLDEIGELAPAVQAKLLRVLQTGQFERLGSAKTQQADVRVIAATNRDLEREVKEGVFRADLYYRLSVFPIKLPPLRERREDVPLLVWHFVARRQAALGRSVKKIPERLMRAFAAYDWPGNVRELENVVERALILTTGSTLAADPAFVDTVSVVPPAEANATLAEAERAHIRAVLDECGWKLSGKGNAAERLGLKRSTLQFRMKKLGLERPARAR